MMDPLKQRSVFTLNVIVFSTAVPSSGYQTNTPQTQQYGLTLYTQYTHTTNTVFWGSDLRYVLCTTL